MSNNVSGNIAPKVSARAAAEAKQRARDRKVFLTLGVLGWLILTLSALDRFPHSNGTPFDFVLPTYAEY